MIFFNDFWSVKIYFSTNYENNGSKHTLRENRDTIKTKNLFSFGGRAVYSMGHKECKAANAWLTGQKPPTQTSNVKINWSTQNEPKPSKNLDLLSCDDHVARHGIGCEWYHHRQAPGSLRNPDWVRGIFLLWREGEKY